MWFLSFIAFLAAVAPDESFAAALTNAQTYAVQHVDAFRNGTPGMIMMKGIGDNNAYMVEIDPATGRIPVDASVTFGYDTNYGTVGDDTLRTAAQIGNAAGAAAFGAGTTSAQVLRVVLPTDQSAIPATQSGAWTVQPGNTANSTPWLMTVAQGGNSATVSAGGALKVDASASTQPVSGTVAATQSGTWTVQPGNTANTTAWKVDGSAVTQPVSGTVTANAGTGTFTTNQSATTTATFQDGSIAFGALTTSFATVITAGGALKNVSLRNNTNAVVVVSLDSGSTTAYTLDSGDALTLDLKILGLNIPTSTTLQAKYSGSAPTSGSIRINGVY